MKLYDSPLQSVTLGRRRYRLRLTFDRVLRAMDAATDPLLTDVDRVAVMLALLFRGRRPIRMDRRMQLLETIMTSLDTAQAERSGPPLTSLTQDAPLIIAAFRQAYGIDLRNEPLPWETFRDLLSGIPADTRYGEVIALRARPLPDASKQNAKYRMELMRAKAAVALEMTEEQRADARRRSASRLAQSLFAWASAQKKEESQHE